MNIVDVASLSGDLVDIRRARLIDRTVDADKVKADRTTIVLTNVLLIPAVLIAFGFVWWLVRAAQTFVPSPRQPVVVPPPTSPPPVPAEPAGHAAGQGPEAHP